MASAFKGGFPAIGPNQTDIPFVFANISQPIYQGGRIRSNIAASSAGLNYQKTEEFRTVLDLKLTVAEAYVGVLRARRNLDGIAQQRGPAFVVSARCDQSQE